MSEVIGFVFSTLGIVWSVITGNWLMSLAVLITIIGYIVSIVNASREQ